MATITFQLPEITTVFLSHLYSGVVYVILVSCSKNNDIEQTANTYKLNTFNKALIKTSKPNLSNLDRLD
jgi:hypothetical protein